MNRVQLVQIIVLIAAIVLGYQTIFCFSYFIANTIGGFLGQKNIADTFTFSYGMLALLFAVSMFLIINNAPKLSLWLTEKVQPDENIELSFSDKNVLLAALLFVLISALIKNVPALLYQLFDLFLKQAGGSSSSKSYDNYFAQTNYPQWIETILEVVLLFKINPIVDYFYSKINPEDPHAIETEEDSIPDNS